MTGQTPARTARVRLCFIVEERYETRVMPGAVVDVFRSPQLRWSALAVGLDVEDVSSSAKVPEAATRLAPTVLRVTRRGAASPATTFPFAPALEAVA